MSAALLFVLYVLSAHALWADTTKSEDKLPVVFVEPLKSTEIFDSLTYPARLTPKINALVLSESDGVVQKLLTPLGTPVKKGAVLAVIKNSDPIYNFAPLKVLAPVTGVVSAVSVTEGSHVKMGSSIAQITNPTKIRISIEVAVSDLSAIEKNLEGVLIVNGSLETYPVRVSGVSPFVDPATGTATADLNLIPQKGKSPPLQPGQVGRVEFKANAHQGIEVATFVIRYDGKKPYVRTVEDGKAIYNYVELGSTRRGMVEITKGPAPGKTLILRTNSYIGDGDRVEVKETKKVPVSE